MERKFKVGDKVKNIRNIFDGKLCDTYIGLVGTINEIDDSDLPYHVKFENGQHDWFEDDELELVKEEYVTKAEFEEFKKLIQNNQPIDTQSDTQSDTQLSTEEKPKDRVEKGQRYWFVDYEGKVDFNSDVYDKIDEYRYKIGNYYLTEEEVKRALEILNILNKYSYDFTKEELEDIDIQKHYILFNVNDKNLIADYSCYCLGSTCLFETEEDCQHAIDEIGYDDYIKYCVMGGIK